jgi:hypothetical protein
MTIVVAGATGLAGSAIARAYEKAGEEVIGINRSVCDLLDREATIAFLKKAKPAIVVADVTSVFWYLFGISTETKEENDARTKNVVYDFFIGTILYPRIGIVDIKMIAECRWSWLTLMLLTTSCAVKQANENGGWLTKEMAMMILAHWLYSNATVKGEHYIPCTWDMFHERFGWMLNFWNTTKILSVIRLKEQ